MMLCSVVVFISLLAQQSAIVGEVTAFMPTSVALQIARRVARDEGYSLKKGNDFFFDVMTDGQGKPPFPGYVTIGFYWNGDIVSAISINEANGQVVDVDMCYVFDYPDIKKLRSSIFGKSSANLLTPAQMANQLGCGGGMRVLHIPSNKPGNLR